MPHVRPLAQLVSIFRPRVLQKPILRVHYVPLVIPLHSCSLRVPRLQILFVRHAPPVHPPNIKSPIVPVARTGYALRVLNVRLEVTRVLSARLQLIEFVHHVHYLAKVVFSSKVPARQQPTLVACHAVDVELGFTRQVPAL